MKIVFAVTLVYISSESVQTLCAYSGKFLKPRSQKDWMKRCLRGGLGVPAAKAFVTRAALPWAPLLWKLSVSCISSAYVGCLPSLPSLSLSPFMEAPHASVLPALLNSNALPCLLRFMIRGDTFGPSGTSFQELSRR